MHSDDVPTPVSRRSPRRGATRWWPWANGLRTRVLAGVVVVLAMLAGAVTIRAASAADSGNPFQRGPEPTAGALASGKGPFATTSVKIPAGNGFGGGVIYYPTDTSQGKFGAIVWSPGMGTEWGWYAGPAEKLASFGFVVFGTDTNSPGDWPDSRGAQLLTALDWLTHDSPVRDRIDANRLGVTGHSAGGGGALDASMKRPSLKVALGLAAFLPGGNMSAAKVPTILFAGQSDGVVTPQYSSDMYGTIPASTPHAYVEIANAGHGLATGDPQMVRLMIPWMKLFLDNDTRYAQFLCPKLADNTGISRYMATCPLTPGSSNSPVPDPPTTNQPTPIQPTPIQPTPIQPTPIQPTPIQPTTGAPTPGQNTAWATIVGAQSNRCVDIDGSTPVNGAAAQLWDCDGTTKQHFTYTTGKQLMVAGTKCLSADGEGTGRGTAVVVSDCTDRPSQKWDIKSDGSIVGVQSGMCMDAVWNLTGNGTRLILWPCHGGVNQRWTLHESPNFGGGKPMPTVTAPVPTGTTTTTLAPTPGG
jgi:hypothetical protein